MAGRTRHINICYNHPDNLVPMISTFAFSGAELWCPYCGATVGAMGGKRVIMTKELKDSESWWRDITREFLMAQSTFTCSSLIYEGKRIAPNQLPENEIKRRRKIISEYVYQGKV